MLRPSLMLALSGLLLAGCASSRRTPPPRVVIERVERPGWEGLATADDQARIAALPTTWAAARAAVSRRAARPMATEGTLLDPSVALDLPAPTPGSNRYRLVRIGGRAAYAAFAPDYCYVEGDGAGLLFTKQTGHRTEPAGGLALRRDRAAAGLPWHVPPDRGGRAAAVQHGLPALQPHAGAVASVRR